MNKISTLLIAAAVAAPCITNAEVKSGQVTVGLYSMKSSNKYSVKPDTQPDQLLGTWTSDANALKYDDATGRYYFDNFLGCENATLEFSVSEDVTKYEKLDNTWANWPRYDFNIYYKTNKTETTGLSYADLCEGLIRPMNQFVATFTVASPYNEEYAVIPAKFTMPESNDYYQLNAGYKTGTSPAGISIYASAPQVITTFSAKPGMNDKTPQTDNSYVTKDGDNYTVYLHFNFTGTQSYTLNGNIDEDAIDAKKQSINGNYLIFTFNKDLKVDQSGIEDIDVDNSNAPVEYFNLQGVRVENPAAGLYIRRQGTKVEKIYLR